MAEIIFKLFLFGLIPIALTILFYCLERFTKFGKIHYGYRQVIIGVSFGIAAIIGTEFGVPINGATANARDAAVLCSGLLFGGPSGLIAGTIGAVERIFSSYWHDSFYSVVACSLSTFLAGGLSWLARRYLFDNKRPTWGFGIAIGIVMEALHLTILFLTHLEDPTQAMEIVKSVALPMILVNALSLAGACASIQLISFKESGEHSAKPKLTQQVQVYLLALVVVGYALTTTFIFAIQTNASYGNANDLLNLNVNDAIDAVINISNDELVATCNSIKNEYVIDPTMDLSAKCQYLGINEINIISNNGIVLRSNIPANVGYDMNSEASNDQAKDFHETITKGSHYYYVQTFRPDSIHGQYKKYSGVLFDDQDGYLQIGLDSAQFNSLYSYNIKQMTKNRHIGETGFFLVKDSQDSVVSDATSFEGKDPGISIADLDKVEVFTRERATIYGIDCFYMHCESETFYYVATLPYSEVISFRDSMFYVNSFMEILVFAVLYVLVYGLLKKLVVNNIHSINSSLSEIINGNLDEKVAVNVNDEFSSLSSDINYTVDTLKNYIEEAKSRIDTELAFAKTIQLSSLPSIWPAFPNHDEFDIFATMDTAKEVGGDFYDLYFIDDNHIAFLIADVSGKGIPAAMFMMESKTLIKNIARVGFPVNEILTKANDALCAHNEANMFVTCWLGICDLRNGHVCFANAGHNAPLIYRKDNNKWEYIVEKKNLVLGGIGGVNYSLQEFDLKPGDRIYLYTDGVTEATRGDKVLYGEKRLIDFLNRHKESSQEEILKGVAKSIDRFIDGADQFDDITMLIFDFLKKQKK